MSISYNNIPLCFWLKEISNYPHISRCMHESQHYPFTIYQIIDFKNSINFLYSLYWINLQLTFTENRNLKIKRFKMYRWYSNMEFLKWRITKITLILHNMFKDICRTQQTTKTCLEDSNNQKLVYMHEIFSKYRKN